MGKMISAIIIYGGKYDKNLFELAKKSVDWCDEIILVNGVKGSFNDWHNEGLKMSKCDWILYVDSDEEITKQLATEISKTISITEANCLAIPRRNFIFNKEFRYSGQYPDYQKRVFRRKNLKKWEGIVHESPVFDGKLEHLNNPMIHRKNMTISEMIEKTNRWSEMEAQLMIDSNHPPMNIFRFSSAAFREFWKRFVKEKAYLDGKEGIIYGIYQIYSKLISYSKLWEKQLQSTIRI